MALFFAIAAKEVWEAVALKDGSLRGKKAATPLFATLGGMVGPISIYLGVAYLMGSTTYDAVANGWASADLAIVVIWHRSSRLYCIQLVAARDGPRRSIAP